MREALAANKTNTNDLWRFAKICRVANVIRHCLETLGHGTPATLGQIASVLAHGEGLQAHARAAEMRLKR